MIIELTYFVHGTTIDNEKHLASGQADAKLSEKGITQGKELIKLINDDFDFIFVSDLSRSIDSARLTFGKERDLIVDKRIRECDYGELTQQVKTWKLKEYINKKYPGGESYLDVEKRMQAFVDDLKKNFDNKKVALVCHQAPQLALEVIVNKLSWEEAIDKDWRKDGKWLPGWRYFIK